MRVLEYSAFQAVTKRMREMAPGPYRRDLQRDTLPPHWVATTGARLPLDADIGALLEWVALATVECATLSMSTDHEGVHLFLIVRGELTERETLSPVDVAVAQAARPLAENAAPAGGPS